MNKVLSVVLIAFVFASCQNSAESEASEVATSDSIATVAAAAPAVVASDPAALNTPTVASSAPAAVPAPAASAMPSSTGSAQVAGGLNPAHGAPGHRCDIAVGAPLSSPLGNAAAGNAAPAVKLKPSQAPVATQPGKAGRINPAHGQPGHDCSVAVGALLKG
jgi:hypothetical protein